MKTTAAAESDLLCSLLEQGRAAGARAPPLTAAEVTAVALPKRGRDERRWSSKHALACMRTLVWFANTVALVLLGIVAVKIVPLCKTTEQVFLCIFQVLIILGIPIMAYCGMKMTKEEIKARDA